MDNPTMVCAVFLCCWKRVRYIDLIPTSHIQGTGQAVRLGAALLRLTSIDHPLNWGSLLSQAPFDQSHSSYQTKA